MQNADIIIRNHDVLGVRKADHICNQGFLDNPQGNGVAGIFAAYADRIVYRGVSVHSDSSAGNHWVDVITWHRDGLIH